MPSLRLCVLHSALALLAAPVLLDAARLDINAPTGGASTGEKSGGGKKKRSSTTSEPRTDVGLLASAASQAASKEGPEDAHWPLEWSRAHVDAATRLIGSWHDAVQNSASTPRKCKFERVDGTIAFFDIHGNRWAKLRASSDQFFEGLVDGKTLRFSVDEAEEKLAIELLQDKFHGFAWIPLPELNRSAPGDFDEEASFWRPTLSSSQVALARSLLGEWTFEKVPNFHYSKVAFDVTKEGELSVVLDGNATGTLQPVGPFFEGSYEESSFEGSLNRFHLDIHGNAIGEWETPESEWFTNFRLARATEDEGKGRPHSKSIDSKTTSSDASKKGGSDAGEAPPSEQKEAPDSGKPAVQVASDKTEDKSSSTGEATGDLKDTKSKDDSPDTQVKTEALGSATESPKASKEEAKSTEQPDTKQEPQDTDKAKEAVAKEETSFKVAKKPVEQKPQDTPKAKEDTIRVATKTVEEKPHDTPKAKEDTISVAAKPVEQEQKATEELQPVAEHKAQASDKVAKVVEVVQTDDEPKQATQVEERDPPVANETSSVGTSQTSEASAHVAKVTFAPSTAGGTPMSSEELAEGQRELQELLQPRGEAPAQDDGPEESTQSFHDLKKYFAAMPKGGTHLPPLGSLNKKKKAGEESEDSAGGDDGHKQGSAATRLYASSAGSVVVAMMTALSILVYPAV